MIRLRLFLLATAFWVQKCGAQAQTWQPNQINASMCAWQSPRVGVIRDEVFIDGGALWWTPGFADGTYGDVTNDENPQGLVYILNFSLPFQTTASFNQSALFTNVSKAAGGGNANNIGPNYLDGAMFANDYEFWTYGGLLINTSEYQTAAADSIAEYELYPSAPGAQTESGFILATLPANMTRYLAWGAAVSVPSENLGFYFAGLRSATWGPIYDLADNQSQVASTLSTRLIEVSMDLDIQSDATWQNNSLPPDVTGRAGGELVWIPVSEQGILVGVGGVIDFAYATVNMSNNITVDGESAAASTAFMNFVSVYDVANGSWYVQATSGTPPTALAQGCTVVASAADGSSHNIYWYGGFDGLHLKEPFTDAVWVLSIPSFTWVQLSNGTTSHARAGHRCVKPYPDQMFVIGGYTPLVGTDLNCVEGGIIQVFNLSSGDWLDSYDPNVWSEYRVPDAVVSKIGGDGSGSAQVTAPSSGFASPNMTALLSSSYNSAKITTFYPYAEATQTSSAPSSTPTKSGGGTPSYLAPVLAVILGLFFITLVVLGILLWRRRRLLKTDRTATQSESGTMDIRFRVSNWLRGTPIDAKAPTVTTEEPAPTPYKYEASYQMPEVGDTQVHEMMDTSSPAELRDTDLHKRELRDTGFVPLSQGPVHELASQAEKSGQRPGSVGTIPRADSPTAAVSNRGGTSVSSDFDHGHLRGLSETSVSTDGNHATLVEDGGSNQPSTAEGQRSTPQGQRVGAVSPLTPSEITASSSGDYINKGNGEAQEVQTTSKRSNFSEELDEP